MTAWVGELKELVEAQDFPKVLELVNKLIANTKYEYRGKGFEEGANTYRNGGERALRQKWGIPG